MNSPSAQPQTLPAKYLSLLGGIALVVRCVLTVMFGLFPFLLGILAQVLVPCRLPVWLVGPLAAAIFFAFWCSTGWLTLTIGHDGPLWPSVLISLALFVFFFSSGVAFIQRRRISVTSH